MKSPGIPHVQPVPGCASTPQRGGNNRAGEFGNAAERVCFFGTAGGLSIQARVFNNRRGLCGQREQHSRIFVGEFCGIEAVGNLHNAEPMNPAPPVTRMFMTASVPALMAF